MTIEPTMDDQEGGGAAARLRQNFIFRTIVRRLLLGVLTLFLVSIVVFAATQLLPGDAARAVLGRDATPDRLAAFRREFHLNQSAVQQYWAWLSGLLQGRPGTSLANGLPVWLLVEPRVVNSFYLLVVVGIVGVPLSMGLGIWAALRRDRWFDHTTSTVTLAAAALPEFVVAIALIILFATVVFQALPPVSLVPPGTSVWSDPDVLVLPVATLTIVVVPYIYRMARGTMIEVLESEYIEMARLKGTPRRELLLRHALPNALAPTIQAIALTFAYLAGGVVVVEYVFGYPGIGQGLVNAVNARDLPTIQFIVLLLAGFYVLVNIVADVVAIMVTPRLRTASWQRT
jgi:peptide/nickel transport system permease protein